MLASPAHFVPSVPTLFPFPLSRTGWMDDAVAVVVLLIVDTLRKYFADTTRPLKHKEAIDWNGTRRTTDETICMACKVKTTSTIHLSGNDHFYGAIHHHSTPSSVCHHSSCSLSCPDQTPVSSYPVARWFKFDSSTFCSCIKLSRFVLISDEFLKYQKSCWSIQWTTLLSVKFHMLIIWDGIGTLDFCGPVYLFIHCVRQPKTLKSTKSSTLLLLLWPQILLNLVSPAPQLLHS